MGRFDERKWGSSVSAVTAFMEDVAPHPDVDAVVFARSADEEVSKWLAEEGVRLVTHDELLSAISLWDVPKQENAIRALRYFLMRVQKDPKLLHRVVSFIEDLSAQASTEAGSLQILKAFRGLEFPSREPLVCLDVPRTGGCVSADGSPRIRAAPRLERRVWPSQSRLACPNCVDRRPSYPRRRHPP